ncbi:MAG: cytochrome-c oxidase, cbb3-type subunit III [Burkholderiales bacterium]|nr:cytochrome-c oxidase, cbb3-type subunit III [Burkholderiales bacterium]
MMSDFTSGFWSTYIVVFTVLAVIFCFLLLTIMGGGDKKSPDETTHVWDGDLTERNNPLPNWWRGLFVGLLVFTIGYLIYYPGLGSFPGIGNWSSVGQFEEEMKDLDAQTKPLYDRYLMMSVQQVAADSEAIGMAERLFLNNCAQCHGSDAKGSVGFPNLRSGAWSWGGTPEAIRESIAEGRTGLMTPLDGILSESATTQVIAYVRSFSGLEHDAAAAAAGQPLFVENCSACHGEYGRGVPEVGGPDLTDNVWVFGSSERAIRESVVNGRNMDLTEGTQAMPAHKELLSQGKVHLLTAYVWGLTNR